MGEQSESNHESPDEHNPPANLRLGAVRSRHPAKHSKDQLTTVTSQHESHDQSHQTINWISKPIERVHNRRGCTMSILSVKPTLDVRQRRDWHLPRPLVRYTHSNSILSPSIRILRRRYLRSLKTK